MPKNDLVKGIDLTQTTATFNAAGASGGTGGGMEIHDLDPASGWHSGTLPWADIDTAGSNLTDIATRAHSSLTGIGANDHHDAVTAGAGIAVAGQVVSLASGVGGSGLLLTAGVLDIELQTNSGLDLTGGKLRLDPLVSGAGLTLTTGVLAVGAGTLITVGLDDVGITPGSTYQFVGTGAGTAAAWQNLSGLAGAGLAHAAGVLSVGVANTGATGLTVEADAIRLTSSSAPGAAAAVLASTAAGALTLKAFTVNGTAGDATLDGTGARLSFSRAGANNVTASAAGSTLRFGSNGTDSDIVLDGAAGRIQIGNSLPLRSDTYVAGTTGWNLSNAGTLDVRKVETQWVEVTGTAGVAQLDSTGARLNFSRNSANYISAGTAGGTLRLGSNAADNDLIIDGANARVEVGNSNTLRTPNYVSQLTGWAVTYAGAADYRYIYTDELHAKAFIADLEQALAGGQIISKSVSMLGADFTCPAAGAAATLTVKDLPSAENMAVFESGDIIRLRVFSRAAGSLTIANCWGVVTSYADQANKLQTWTFTRSSGGNAGSVAAGTVIATDSIVLDYGTTGNGYYEVNSIDGLRAVNSPYAQVVTWATHPATGQTIRSRWGNLLGVTGVSGEFGLFAGQGVTDADGYIVASSVGLKLRNMDLEIFSGANKTVDVSTSGDMQLGTLVTAAATTSFDFVASTGVLRVGTLGSNKPNLYWSGTALSLRNNTTDVITLDTSGAAYFAGPMTIGTSGGIYQGTGTFASPQTGLKIWNSGGTGVITGYNATVVQWYANTDGKLYAGAGNVVLDSTGITATAGTIGGWTLGATSLTSGSGANTRGVDSGGTNPAFYAGSATPGSAPFRVTAAGALTATSATITGTVISGAGTVTLDTSGIRIGIGTSDVNMVKWSNGSDDLSRIYTQDAGISGVSTYIESRATSGNGSRIVLSAYDTVFSGANAFINIATSDAGLTFILGEATNIEFDATSFDIVATNARINTNAIWHAGNDGAGSTLDADTLDTYQAAAFPRLAASNTFSTTNTFNERITITAGSSNIYAYLNSAGTNENIELRFANNTTSVGRLLYTGGAATKYFGFINSGADYLGFGSDDTRWLNPSFATQYMKLTSGGLRIGTGSITAGYALDVAGKALFDNGIRLALGDPTGAASTLTYTGDSTTSISTGVGAVKMRSTTGRTNTAFIAVYIGTTKYWIPAWSNID